MVKRLAFAVPGDLAIPTGGYAYDRRMIAELGRLGWRIDIVNLGDGFPLASEATRANCRALNSLPNHLRRRPRDTLTKLLRLL